jgi:6,7-dimethyl-8-ribityllumazine synthase
MEVYKMDLDKYMQQLDSQNDNSVAPKAPHEDIVYITGDLKHEDIKHSKIAIILTEWHKDICDELLGGSVKYFQEVGISPKKIKIYRVPGCLEIPRLARVLSDNSRFDVILCFGAQIASPIESHALFSELLHISTHFNTVLINGILATETKEEALKYLSMGEICAKTALKMLALELTV